MNKNLLPVAIVLAGALVAGGLVYINQGKAGFLPPQEAADKAIAFIDKSIEEDVTISLVSVVEESGVYKIHFKINEAEYDSYVTRDARILFSSAFILEEEEEEAVKRDIPDVKLFVMSYCPYGLQAQKMFLPVYDLLKEEADMAVYFVSYIMHDKAEIDENLRQYCIQKEEKEKYYDYLSCFVVDGSFEECLSQASIDEVKLDSCVSATDEEYNITAQYNDESTWLSGYYPRFDVQSDLNEQYGVQGSPTVVINDKIVSINPRSPEKFKEAVCEAFNSQPEDCSQTLSEEAFSAGFGTEEGSSSEGSCQ